MRCSGMQLYTFTVFLLIARRFVWLHYKVCVINIFKRFIFNMVISFASHCLPSINTDAHIASLHILLERAQTGGRKRFPSPRRPPNMRTECSASSSSRHIA